MGAQAQVDTLGMQREINGTQLYIKVIGEGEPLLIVHGGPGVNHEYFLPHLLPLAKKYKLIFYDQRSCGKSAIPETIPDLKLEKMMQDIHAIKDSLHLAKINVLAHSWGARIALNYALVYQRDIKSMILVNPVPLNHDYDKMQTESVKSKTEPMDEIVQDDLIHSEAFKNGDAATVEQLYKLNFKTSFFDTSNLSKLNLALPDGFLEANKMLMMGLQADIGAYDKDIYEFMPTLKFPILIVHGNADHIPVEADEKLNKVLPKSELVRFTSSGHFPFIEENKKFTDTIDAFLQPQKKEEGKK